jgi:hypothetical protein
MPKLVEKKRKPRVHSKASGILIVLEGGKLKDVSLFNTKGHVFVADLDALAGLPLADQETTVLMGYPAKLHTHAAFEAALEEILAADVAAPDEAASTPATVPADTDTPVQPSPVVDVPTATPAAPLAVPDPTVDTAVRLNEVLTPGTVSNEVLAASIPDPVMPTVVVADDPPVGPLPNPAASAGPVVSGPESVAGSTAAVQV